ncbi:MAG: pyruvate, phosphate dikinase [Nitrososphaerales archaeon]
MVPPTNDRVGASVLLFSEARGLSKFDLGGKGAGLAEMTGIGMPVPPGLTILTRVCREYYANGGRLPDGLEDEVKAKLGEVEKVIGRKFGDPTDPLLLSVRSGAPFSMPGMMDTILNLGLNDESVKVLGEQTNDLRFAYDNYRRFIQMFSKVVLKLEAGKFEELIVREKQKRGVEQDVDLDKEAMRNLVEEFKNFVKEETGDDFPQNPWLQMSMAIGAVFDSWMNERAKEYRRIYKISEELGTGVNIQVMVFGNRTGISGTGVVFTRNPSTGDKKLFGEFLMNAQGEDIVSGVRTPRQIDDLKAEAPKLYNELLEIATTLENHYRDMQDIEFTIDNGTLHLLQTRTGARTALAAVKMAVDMKKEGLIDTAEALKRVEPQHLDLLLHKHIDPTKKIDHIAEGLPASPGAVSGKAVFDVAEATTLGNKGEKVILVRLETIPEDIHGMVASEGMLTSRGGMACHAALVARGMGKPAIVGCEAIKIDQEKQTFSVKDVVVSKGDLITIDGTTGRVILGEVPTIEPELGPELKELLSWADDVKKLGVRANADTPEGAQRARSFGAEGIGLCRTERMFNIKDRLPIVQEMILADSEEERKRALDKLLPMQRDDFKAIFKAMDGLPVTIRMLDLPLHEFLPRHEELIAEVTAARLVGKDSEELRKKEIVLKKVEQLVEHNPMLGHRGCRLAVKYPEIYEMQTRAIFEAAAELKKENCVVKPELMIPLLSDARELYFHRKNMEKIADAVLKQAGVEVDYLIGTMIETPRAALTATKVAEFADFFSFGSNDLTQTTFAYSRDDAEAKFMPLYVDKGLLLANPFEILDREGVGKLIIMAVESGRSIKHGLKIGICGEHGGEPGSIEFFHHAGLDYVSCSPFRIPIARLAAAQVAIGTEKASSTA